MQFGQLTDDVQRPMIIIGQIHQNDSFNQSLIFSIYVITNNCLLLQPVSVSDSSRYSTPLGWAEQHGAATAHTLTGGVECTICYENPIDAVLYMCGHMCMCYECALQQWRGKGGGHCPLCRAVIRDVIRTYKS